MALTKIKTSNLETSIDLTGINDTATSQILTVSDTGIDVTGTVTADGLTVDGNATISSGSPTLVLEDTEGAAQDDARLQVGASIFNIKRDADNLPRFTVGLSTGDISFYEDTGTTAKFFWDASAEKLGIGTTSPSNTLHLSSTSPQIKLEDTDATGYSKVSGSGANIYLQADEGNTVADSKIDFRVDGSQRMVIDSSGNLLVGTTSTDLNANQGQKLTGQQLWSTRTSAASAYFNRLTSDGEIVVFKKDGTNVGVIGAYSGEMYIASTAGTDAGLRLGYDTVVPATTAGVNRDAAINLGASNGRFQDAYLSGGVYLGGTGSANKLDDYEEGVHQYTITGATSGSMSPRSGYEYFAYTKIGRVVHIQGRWETIGTHNAVGYLKFSLPFAAANLDLQSGVGGGYMSLYRSGSVYRDLEARVYEGNSYFRIFYHHSSLDDEALNGEDVNSTIEGIVSFSYIAA